MTRSTRVALFLALVSALALPQATAATPPDRSERTSHGTEESWLAWLWAPVAHLLGRADATGGRYADANGVGARRRASVNGSSEGGPHIDPNGFAAPPPTSNTETDGGPDIDPDG